MTPLSSRKALCPLTQITFPIVHFNMFPQLACLMECKITLAAFVRHLFTVCLQMSIKMPSPRLCIFTVVAFITLHPLFSNAFSHASHVLIAQNGPAPALGFQSLMICSLQIMHNHNGCHCMILLHCVL